MEENDVKSTSGGTRLDFKIEKYEEFSLENLTRCYVLWWKSDKTKKTILKSDALYFFKSKSDALYFFQFKIRHVMKFSIQNHAFQKSTKNAKYVVFT